MQRWLARKGRGHSTPWLLIVYGVGMIMAGIAMIDDRGPHAINPAPLVAIPLFIGAGVCCLAVGIAQIRERR